MKYRTSDQLKEMQGFNACIDSIADAVQSSTRMRSSSSIVRKKKTLNHPHLQLQYFLDSALISSAWPLELCTLHMVDLLIG